MTRTDRLLGLLLALRGGRQTAARLAARFEVSRRTILRDLDALGQLGVPVVALPGPGGGFSLADGYWLPPLRFSADEAGLLLLALTALGDPTASPFGDARRAAEEKLRGALQPDVLAAAEAGLAEIALAPPRAPTPEHFRLVQRAIRDRRWLRVDYHSLRRPAHHLLLPRSLRAEDGRWFLRALSLEAGEERTYRLDRVRAATPVPPPPNAAAVIAAAADPSPRTAYDDPSHPEVVVRLSYAGVRLAEDASNWAGRFVPLDADTWQLRFRCPPAELTYYARELHALGPTALVLAPPTLRLLVRRLAVATAARYPAEEGGTEPAPANTAESVTLPCHR